MKNKILATTLFILGVIVSLAAIPMRPDEPPITCPEVIQGEGRYIILDDECWYEHTYEEDTGTCASCHPEILEPFEMDWYPVFRVFDGELVTVWNVDGDICTLGDGTLVPCDALYSIPPLPPCKKIVSYLAINKK